MHDDFEFEININKSLLQHYDQDSSKMFTVNVKAFNRAGHFTVARSDPFQIHSKQLPSTGIVYHVLNADATEEIGYQEDTSQLCVRWFGFVHHTEELTYQVAIGSQPNEDDVHVYEASQSNDTHCVTGLSLAPMRKYYATVRAQNEQGISQASTHGVFVAAYADVIAESAVNFGPGCPSLFQHVLYELEASDDNFTEAEFNLDETLTLHVSIPLTSLPTRTIRIIYTNTTVADASSAAVEVNGAPLVVDTWEVDEAKLYIFYNFVHMQENVTVKLQATNDVMSNVLQVAIDECRATLQYQISPDIVRVKMSFNPAVSQYITSFETGFDNAENTTLHNCGVDREIFIQTSLQNGVDYHLQVSPCFAMTCLTPIQSHRLRLETSSPQPHVIRASLHKDPHADWIDTNNYVIEADWNLFTVADNDSVVTVYDWSIATEESGAKMVVPWARTEFAREAGVAQVDL